MTNMDLSEQRIVSIEHRIDLIEAKQNSVDERSERIIEHLAKIEGAVGEMRWTLRIVILIGGGILYRLINT